MSDKKQPNQDVQESEIDRVRRRYLYRKLALNGQTKMPARLAMKLVGPDCAYHLYHQHCGSDQSNQK